MSAFVTTMPPAFFETSDERVEHFVQFRPNLAHFTGDATLTPSTSSTNFSAPGREPLRRAPTPGLLSRTASTSSITTTYSTPRSDFVTFSGWRDQYDEDEHIEPQETQRFPTSYLRHRCSTPTEETRDQRNYVWYTQAHEDIGKADMMDQDVQVKIEEVDGTLEAGEEATFWQVSGPGFVWGRNSDETQQIRDHPMDEE
ncbi:unnamed protein product [Peniophora sp. CBMAI 1063]|nr:unnamed protein product [Peniophora sp. CBMAI 1063]